MNCDASMEPADDVLFAEFIGIPLFVFGRVMTLGLVGDEEELRNLKAFVTTERFVLGSAISEL